MLYNIDFSVKAAEQISHAGHLLEQLSGLFYLVSGDVQGILQRIHHGIVNAHHDDQRNNRGQAAPHRVDALLLVKLLHFLRHFLLVITIFFLNLFLFSLQPGIFGHRLLLLNGKRKHDYFQYYGKQNNRDAVILGKLVKKPKQVTENVTDPTKNLHTCDFPPNAAGLGGRPLLFIFLFSFFLLFGHRVVASLGEGIAP